MIDFDELSYGDRIEYDGPTDFEGDHVAPQDWKQPYEFRYVSMFGTLACHDRYNGLKNLAPDHPANNADYWTVVNA